MNTCYEKRLEALGYGPIVVTDYPSHDTEDVYLVFPTGYSVLLYSNKFTPPHKPNNLLDSYRLPTEEEKLTLEKALYALKFAETRLVNAIAEVANPPKNLSLSNLISLVDRFGYEYVFVHEEPCPACGGVGEPTPLCQLCYDQGAGKPAHYEIAKKDEKKK